MLPKKLALVTAAIAIIGGVVGSFLTHTEEAAAKALAAKPYSAMTAFDDLVLFPEVENWRVLYNISQADWYAANHKKDKKRQHGSTKEDRLISHIFAYLPADVPMELDLEWAPLPESAAIILNKSLRLLKLPPVSPNFIVKAGRKRFHPDADHLDRLWFEVTYFELEDGVRFVEMARIPFRELQPERYKAAHPNED